MDYFKLAISNPCANDWEAMTESAEGRFCTSCSKNVVDFTSQSESEIKAYVQKHAGEKICGRFYKQQIETIRIEFDSNILHSDIRFWQKFLVVLLVCFGSEVFGINFCIAQDQFPDSSIVLVDSTEGLCADTLTEALEADSVIEIKMPVTIVPLNLELMIMGGIGLFYESEVLDFFTFTGLVICTPEEKKEEAPIAYEKPAKPVAAPVDNFLTGFNMPILPTEKPRDPNHNDQQNLFVWDTASKKRRKRGKLPQAES